MTAPEEEAPGPPGGEPSSSSSSPRPASSARQRLESLEEAFQEYARETASGEVPVLSTRQLERLLEISRAMNRIHDRDELLSYVGDRLRELFDAENSFVVLFDDRGRSRIHSSHLRETTPEPSPISETLLRRVRESREPVLIDDCGTDAELRDQSSIRRLRISSALCAPLIIEGEVIGALQFDHRGEPHPFPPSDVRLLSMFADQAATAFHNLQLIERLGGALREIQQAQSQLVQAERLSALGEMAAGMAHDFNNTLFVALGLCDVLLARESLDQEVVDELDKIRTCALDAANTVRRLQLFARGEPIVEPAPGRGATETTVDLAALVEQMPEFTRAKWVHEARRRGVSIEMRTALESTPPVRGKPAEIREVLLNLVFNAVDSMERSGTVTLSTGLQGDRAFVAVTDEGVGMDAAMRQRIFEPFFTTKGSRGSGFGLSTCWSIARQLGGEVAVDSEPGRGSTFTLWLPVVDQRAPVEPPDATPSWRRARILVIDDDEQVLRSLRKLLEAMGHEVAAFTDAGAALTALGEGRFEVVVTDLGMPGLTGSDVVREARRLQPGLPVLILTGWGSDVELEDSVRESADGVLAKPITLRSLRFALERVLPACESPGPG